MKFSFQKHNKHIFFIENCVCVLVLFVRVWSVEYPKPSNLKEVFPFSYFYNHFFSNFCFRCASRLQARGQRQQDPWWGAFNKYARRPLGMGLTKMHAYLSQGRGDCGLECTLKVQSNEGYTFLGYTSISTKLYWSLWFHGCQGCVQILLTGSE